MVMHTVHIRRYDKQAKPFVEPAWQANIAMVEHWQAAKQQLKQYDRQWRDAKPDNHGQFIPHRQTDFDWVESQGSCHVDIAVNMMNTVQSP